MSSAWQKIEVPLVGPLDEKGKPEALGNGSLTVALNAIQTRDGALGKRRGHTALSSSVTGGGSISSGSALFGFRDAPCVIDGTFTYSYSPTDTSWRLASRVTNAGLSRIQCFGLGTQPDFFDVAYCNGYYILAGASAGVVYVVIDAATGVRVSPVNSNNAAGGEQFIASAGLATNTTVKLCVVGNAVVFVYWDTSLASTVQYSTLDCSSASTIAAGASVLANVATDVKVTNGFALFDASGGATRWYFAYINTAGTGSSVSVKSFNTAGTLQTSTTAAGGTTPTTIGLGVDETDRIWVAWNNAGGLLVSVVGLTPSALGTPLSTLGGGIITLPGGAVPSSLGIVGKGGGAAHVMLFDSTSINTYWRNVSTVAGAVSTSGTTQRVSYNVVPISRQVFIGGRVLCSWMPADNLASSQLPDPPQGVTEVVDITDAAGDQQWTPRPVCTVTWGLGQAFRFLGSGLSCGLMHWATVSATKLATAQVCSKAFAGANAAGGPTSLFTAGGTSSLDIFPIDFASAGAWQAAPLGEGVSLSGGCATYFDGKNVAEMGFVSYPTVPTVSAPQSFTGGLTVGTAYTYKAVYEATDALGVVHQSAPSVASASVTPTAGNTQCTVTVRAPSIYARPDLTMRIVLYRSKGTAIFKRLFSGLAPAGTTPGTISFTDQTTDSVGDTGANLYTEGGALPRFRPPAMSTLTVHQDRLFGVDETGKNVWYSGQYIYGDAPWFTVPFQFTVDAGGTIVALGSMDGRLYIFKRDRIFYVTGDGPVDNGAGLYSLPAPIPTQVGCIEPRSVVTTPLGIFFQSDQGIYLLTRSHEVQFVGRGIEQTLLGTVPTITSAAMNEVLGRVYFTASTGSGTGLRLEYDLVHHTWSTTLVNGFQEYIAGTVVGGTIGGVPKWYGLASNGSVHGENAGFAPTYLDPGSGWQTTILTTGWIKLDGEQAYSRIRNVALLAEQVTPCNITISVSYNYATTATDVRTWTADVLATILATAGTNMAQLGVGCSRQKVESIKISIQDAAPTGLVGVTGTGQGMNFLGLAFEVAPKTGTFRLPAINSQ